VKKRGDSTAIPSQGIVNESEVQKDGEGEKSGKEESAQIGLAGWRADELG
jgi:hypothetical protein